jgi:N,N'-diacetyllegionaminate synthase
LVTINIENKKIGDNLPVYFVAEAGLNHNGNIKTAKQMIDTALDCGSDAIKFQTYKTENFLTKKSEYFEFFKSVELSYSDFSELNDYAKQVGITFFSAPFDFESASFLQSINVSCFKIASSDITNVPLLKQIANTKIPTIISTGLSTMAEIQTAVDIFQKAGNDQIIILHSVSNYPTDPSESNLSVIETLKENFPYPIGYSDNGSHDLVDLVAASLGYSLIERHFTLDKKMEGPDHFFSIPPTELKNLISNIRLIEEIRGKPVKNPQPSESAIKNMIRKSIFANNTIEQGEVLSTNNIGVKRPASGIEPKFFDDVIGRTAKKKILSDDPILWDDLD